jgi:hypothetical protein
VGYTRQEKVLGEGQARDDWYLELKKCFELISGFDSLHWQMVSVVHTWTKA